MDDWAKVQLDDVADLSGGYAFKSSQYTDAGRFVLRTVNIDDQFSITLENANFISEAEAKEFERFALQEHDTLFVMVAATLGKIGYVRARDLPALLNQNMWVIRAKEGAINPVFLHYLFRQISKIPLSWVGGSARSFLRRDDVRKLEFELPGSAEQERIAHTLKTLDDKIELNRRMNETLEEMARALFRDWFVDFGPTRRQMDGTTDPATIMGHAFPPEKATTLAPLFPAKLGDDGLPEGWSIGEVSDVADLNPKSWSAKNHPQKVEYVDLSNTKWGRIEEVTLYDWSEAPSRARRILEEGDSIVGTVRPGNGSYSLIGRAGLTGSTGFAVLRPKQSKATEFVYCALTSHDNIENLANLADGGAYPAINPKVVAATEIARTGTDLVDAFSNVTQSMFAKRHANDQENQTLAEMRDLLLPKLMSGEIRLIDAEAVS